MPIYAKLLLGAFAGYAGTIAMTQFQNRAGEAIKKKLGSEPDTEPSIPDEKPATTKVADRIYAAVTNRELPRAREESAGLAVHYLFGSLMGLGFVGFRQVFPRIPVADGLVYGALVWIFADEIGNSVVGLAPPPWKTKRAIHAYAMLSHLVYGAALSGAYEVEEKIAA